MSVAVNGCVREKVRPDPSHRLDVELHAAAGPFSPSLSAPWRYLQVRILDLHSNTSSLIDEQTLVELGSYMILGGKVATRVAYIVLFIRCHF